MSCAVFSSGRLIFSRYGSCIVYHGWALVEKWENGTVSTVYTRYQVDNNLSAVSLAHGFRQLEWDTNRLLFWRRQD